MVGVMPQFGEFSLFAGLVLRGVDLGPVSTSQRNCLGLLVILPPVSFLGFLDAAHGMLTGKCERQHKLFSVV